MDTIDWTRPLTFIVRGNAYPCAGGSWTQLSIGLLYHGAQGRTPVYLWVIGMAVCGDKDMAALASSRTPAAASVGAPIEAPTVASHFRDAMGAGSRHQCYISGMVPVCFA